MGKNRIPCIVITRAENQCRDFEAAVKNLGFETFCLPSIIIKTRLLTEENRPVVDKLKKGNFDWVIFTSSNGVEALSEIAGPFDFPLKTKVAVIGDKTSQVFRQYYKREPELKPKKFISESLLEEFKGQNATGKSILLVTASKAREVVPSGLKELGAEVESLIAYDNEEVKIENSLIHKLERTEHLVFTFFSPSAVNSVCLNLSEKRHILDKAEIVSIGPITTKALMDKGLKVDFESQDHSEQGVLTILNKYVTLKPND